MEVRRLTMRLMMDSFVRTSATGWVAISNRRKLRFSVRRTPLSTSPLASRSRTCFSWKPIFITFQVSPEISEGQRDGRKVKFRLALEHCNSRNVRTTQKVYPRVDTQFLHLLLRSYHLQGFVKNCLASLSVINNLDNTVRNGHTSPVGIFD